MKQWTIVLGVVALVLALGMPAWAQDSGADAGKSAEAAKAKDEKPKEAKAGDAKNKGPRKNARNRQNAGGPKGAAGAPLDKFFDEADGDKDGKLDKTEFKKAMMLAHEWARGNNARGNGPGGRPGPRETMGQRIRQADTNNDQKVDWDEFKAAFPGAEKERFKAMDKNGDGVLDQADMPQRGPVRGDRPRLGRQGNPGGPNMFQMVDADKDGKVTFEEMSARREGFPKEAFDRMDKNGDGAVTEDELKGLRQNRGQGRRR